MLSGRRWYLLVGLTAVLYWTSSARGHFPFIVPETADKAIVVFSDDLTPDPNVNIEKIANTRLTLRRHDGQETPLSWTKGNNCYHLTLPAGELRIIYGVTDYGILQKGETPPFKLVYYPKMVLGNATDRRAIVGNALPLEITAEGQAGNLRFRVLRRGQPMPEAEVTVILPDGSKKSLVADKQGYTPAFKATGRYGVWTRWTEPQKGEQAGRTFHEVRHYATLVCDVVGS